MATLRAWLNEEGFDWKTGKIIAHTLKEGSYSPGWGDMEAAYFWDYSSNLPAMQMDALLDTEFDDGYGSPNCPRFIAEDATKLYFPWQYDGSTGLQSVVKDIMHYISNATPYPGG
jgi:hypothetical protein